MSSRAVAVAARALAIALSLALLAGFLPGPAPALERGGRDRRDATSLVIPADAVRRVTRQQRASGGEQFVVRTDPAGPDPGRLADDLAARLGITVTHVYRAASNGFAALVPDGAVKRLRAERWVTSVEPVFTVEMYAQTTPVGISRIQVDGNSTAGLGTLNRTVDADIAIVDSGIDSTHPDLNYQGGIDCTGGASPGTDQNGHGTHVAGTAAARNNDLGVVGVAPGARLWSYKVFGASGSATSAVIYCALDSLMLNAGVIDVANMSLGGGGGDTANCGGDYHQRICAVVNAGVSLAVAAGNSGTNAASFVPAAFDEVVTVSALVDTDGLPGGLGTSTTRGRDDALASFSNYGPDVDIAAPGVATYSTYPMAWGGYQTMSGTSMATPHVAGAMALIAAANPSFGPAEIRAALLGHRAAGQILDDPDAHDEGVLNVNDGPPWGQPPLAEAPWDMSPPANDERGGAVPLDVSESSALTLQAWGATGNAGDPAATCSGYTASVWYRISPAEATRLLVSTAGSAYDTVLAVYAASGSTLTQVACNDDVDASSDRTSIVKFRASAGTDYYVMAGAYWSGAWAEAPSILELSVSPLAAGPAYDELAGAVAIGPSLPFSATVDATASSPGAGDPVLSSCPAYTDSIWFRHSAPNAAPMTLSTGGSEFDTVLAVFRESGGTLTQVACNDDAAANGFRTSRLRFTPEAGATYAVLVGSKADASGDVTLWAGMPPANDEIAAATAIGSLPHVSSVDAAGATGGTGDPQPAACEAYHGSVWYSLQVPSATVVTVSTAGSGYDTVALAFDGTPSNASLVGCNDDFGTSRTSSLTFAAQPGRTYLVAIGAWYNSSLGALTLSASGVPAPTPTPVPTVAPPPPPPPPPPPAETPTPEPTATATPPPAPEPTKTAVPDPDPTVTPEPGAPTASIVSPGAGQRIVPRGSVKVRASDPDGDRIVLVEVLACPGANCDPQQATVIGRHSRKPWKVRIAAPLQSGELTMIARATTDDGETGLSAPVTVTVSAKPAKADEAGKDRDRGRRDGKRRDRR